MHDGIHISGRLRLTQIDSAFVTSRPQCEEALQKLIDRGSAKVIVQTHNLVTDLGLSVISRLVGAALSAPSVSNGTQTFSITDISELQIDEMQFGNLANPAAPTSADYELEDPAPLTTVTPVVTYPTSGSVRWSGTIVAGLFSGNQITEEALFCANGALFARTTFPSQAITSGFGIQADHDFVFTRG